jgi:hypothetical protein
LAAFVIYLLVVVLKPTEKFVLRAHEIIVPTLYIDTQRQSIIESSLMDSLFRYDSYAALPRTVLMGLTADL